MKKLVSIFLLSLMTFGAIEANAFPVSTHPHQKHLTKKGKPDKRFKENKKHLKKDGTPDKRFKKK